MSGCKDACEGDKRIVVYPRRLTGWRLCVLKCSQHGEISRFDFHSKKGQRPATDYVWDSPRMAIVMGIFFSVFATVQAVRFARMFSMMDIADFAVWCFTTGGVAILVYGCARE